MSEQLPSDELVSELLSLAAREDVLEPWFDCSDARLCRKAVAEIKRLREYEWMYKELQK
jgi:hypothetical protein